MKLSHAIRLGATLKPQGFGTLESAYQTCAIGAAIDALGGYRRATAADIWRLGMSSSDGRVSLPLRVGDPFFEIPEEWLGVLGKKLTCPQCSQVEGILEYLIPHMNDEHRWTREQIADWVEEIEPQEQGTPTPEEEHVEEFVS